MLAVNTEYPVLQTEEAVRFVGAEFTGQLAFEICVEKIANNKHKEA